MSWNGFCSACRKKGISTFTILNGNLLCVRCFDDKNPELKNKRTEPGRVITPVERKVEVVEKRVKVEGAK